jgi:hypothetical protein
LPILAHPRVEVPEWFWAKRVEALLALRPDAHESAFLQDAEMPRYAGLVDIDGLHDVVDRMLSAAKHFDDIETRRVGQNSER